MGKVLVSLKIFPKEGKLEEAKQKILELKPIMLREEDIAFGIIVLKAAFLLDDKEGTTKLEEEIRKIEEVSEFDIVDQTLTDAFEEHYEKKG
ncbi:MAG: elongation factor 1-beta [Candidatus Micrarchaeales archaeon]